MINFSGAAHFLCKSGHKAINKRGRLGRSPTIRCTSQGWTEPKTECVKVSVLTAKKTIGSLFNFLVRIFSFRTTTDIDMVDDKVKTYPDSLLTCPN